MAYGSDDGGVRLFYPADGEQLVIRIDAAAIRRRGGGLDPYFGTVIRDLVCGVGAAPADLRRCAIAADDLLTDDEIAAAAAQGRLFG